VGEWDVDAMAERMSTSLLFEWSEWFALKHEAEKKAMEQAKQGRGKVRRR